MALGDTPTRRGRAFDRRARVQKVHESVQNGKTNELPKTSRQAPSDLDLHSVNLALAPICDRTRALMQIAHARYAYVSR